MASNRKEVFIIEKEGTGENEKSFWHKAGTAWVNRDGSINFRLHVLPGVQFQVRDPKESGNGDRNQ